MNYYGAAASWSRCEDTTKAFLYLEKSIDKGFTDIAMLDSSDSFIPLKAYMQWNVLLGKIKFKLDKYGSLRDTLEDLYLKDKVLRRTLGCIIDEYGAPSKELSALKMMIAQQDSLNEILVKEIVAEHGWLGVNLIGNDANTGLWAVVQHGSLDLQKQMLAAIKESVHQGYTTGGNYALMYDRIEISEGRPQLYGSQIENLDNGAQTLYPILDMENVDKRRAVYGLEPIRDYLKYFEIDYDKYLKSIKN
jgi:hypothetical protein